MSGLTSDNVVTGQVNVSTPPSYRHYSFTFPNDEFGFKISGNYFLEVYDQYRDQLIFRIPFFVHETKGRLTSRIEKLYNQRSDGRSTHQPYATYVFGDLGVSNPEFYLSYYFVQNRFWGKAKEVDITDISTRGEVNFQLARERSFPGNIDFSVIDLDPPRVNDQKIRQIVPETIPNKILLKRDLLGFDKNPEYVSYAGQGLPNNSSSSQYWEVQFRLDAQSSTRPGDDVYIVGDFNNWSIHPEQKMNYDASKSLWKGNAFIKSGQYAYKYATVKNGTINDLKLDNAFSYSRNVYTTLVYFNDPNEYLYRLVHLDRFYSR